MSWVPPCLSILHWTLQILCILTVDLCPPCPSVTFPLSVPLSLLHPFLTVLLSQSDWGSKRGKWREAIFQDSRPGQTPTHPDRGGRWRVGEEESARATEGLSDSTYSPPPPPLTFLYLLNGSGSHSHKINVDHPKDKLTSRQIDLLFSDCNV